MGEEMNIKLIQQALKESLEVMEKEKMAWEISSIYDKSILLCKQAIKEMENTQ